MKHLEITICLVICILAGLFVGGCQKRPAEPVPAPTSANAQGATAYEVLVPLDYKETISFHEEISSGYVYLELFYKNNSEEEVLVVYNNYDCKGIRRIYKLKNFNKPE